RENLQFLPALPKCDPACDLPCWANCAFEEDVAAGLEARCVTPWQRGATSDQRKDRDYTQLLGRSAGHHRLGPIRRGEAVGLRAIAVSGAHPIAFRTTSHQFHRNSAPAAIWIRLRVVAQ